MPKFWPQPRHVSLGLGLEHLASAWPRSCSLGLEKCAIQRKIILAVSTSWLHHCNIHYEDVVKHSNVGQKFTYVFLALSPCVLIHRYLHVAGLALKTWSLPRRLGLGLEDLVSASKTWSRPRRLGLGLEDLVSASKTWSQLVDLVSASKTWSRPRRLGLGLEDLVSASKTWSQP